MTIDVVRSDDREVPVEYRFEFPPIYGGNTQSLTRAIPGGGDHGAATDTAKVTLTDYHGFVIDQRTAVIEIPVAVPTITSISPESGYADTIVTITGYGFGETKGSVFFNTTPTGIFGSWSDTEIKTQVPIGATSGNVIVRDNAGRSSNGIYFEVKEVCAKIADCFKLEFTPSDCDGNPIAPSVKLPLVQVGCQLAVDPDYSWPSAYRYTASGSVTQANVSLSFARTIDTVFWDAIQGTFSGTASQAGLAYTGTVVYRYSKEDCDADHTLDNVPFLIDLSRCAAP